jgi:hypothetical protein
MGTEFKVCDYIQNVRTTACCGCGCEQFRILIFSCGNDRPQCISCSSIWETPVGVTKPDYSGQEAVGGAPDESQDVVQEAGGITEIPYEAAIALGKKSTKKIG